MSLSDSTFDNKASDFEVGDTVLHVFHGRYCTVVRVGRKYVYCYLNTGTVVPPREFRFVPSSLKLYAR